MWNKYVGKAVMPLTYTAACPTATPPYGHSSSTKRWEGEAKQSPTSNTGV